MATSTLGTLAVYLTANTSSFNNALRKANSLVGVVSTGVKLGAAAAGAALATFAAKSIQSAIDAEETFSKFDVVFRDVKSSAESVANSLSQNYGLASSTSKQLLSDTGDLLSGFGFAQKEALQLSKSVNELAVDLASFTNFSGGAKGASEALTKALLGERESLKSLGISILEEDVKAQVALNASKGMTFATERQAKAFATLSLAQAQSKNAIGDYARTQDGAANQLRLFSERFTDLKNATGSFIMKLIDIPGAVNGGVNSLEALTNTIKSNAAEWNYLFKEAFIYIGSGIQTIGVILKPLGTLLSGFGKFAVDVFFTAGQNIRNIFWWLLDNWSQVLDNMGKLLKADLQDFVNFSNELDSNVWKMITGKETDFAGMIARSGSNLQKAMNDAKIPPIEIASPDFEAMGNDLKSSLESLLAIPDSIAKIGQATEDRLDKLFESEQAKAGAIAKSAKPEDATADKPITGVPEMKFAGAVEKGTVEAYRAELAGKGTSEEYNKKTADNTGKLVQEARKQTSSLKKLDAIEVY